jgi:hypothetical protein
VGLPAREAEDQIPWVANLRASDPLPERVLEGLTVGRGWIAPCSTFERSDTS